MEYRRGATRALSGEEDEAVEAELFPAPQHPAQPLVDEMDPWSPGQEQLVKSPMVCKWDLADAQQKLCCLELHSSESLEQEHAKARMECLELKQEEEEWRHKEEILKHGETTPEETDGLNKDVFNKSFINHFARNNMEDEDENKTFIQKFEQQMRHFGMLSRWDDSLRFLSELPHLVCEETANYLAQWCFHLELEQKEALMKHVAHQAIVMQFIIEMAKSYGANPRSCFRLFFQKAKTGEDGYTEAFRSELEVFIAKVRRHSRTRNDEAVGFHESWTHQKPLHHSGLDSARVLESLPPVAEYDKQHSLAAGLWMCNTEGARQEVNEEPSMDLF